MKYTKEILEPIVKNSISVAEVIRKLGLKQSCSSHSQTLNFGSKNIKKNTNKMENIEQETNSSKEEKKSECKHNWVMDGHNAGDPICSKCLKYFEE